MCLFPCHCLYHLRFHHHLHPHCYHYSSVLLQGTMHKVKYTLCVHIFKLAQLNFSIKFENIYKGNHVSAAI